MEALYAAWLIVTGLFAFILIVGLPVAAFFALVKYLRKKTSSLDPPKQP